MFFPDYYNIYFGAISLESKKSTTVYMRRPLAVMCTILSLYFWSPINLLLEFWL